MEEIHNIQWGSFVIDYKYADILNLVTANKELSYSHNPISVEKYQDIINEHSKGVSQFGIINANTRKQEEIAYKNNQGISNYKILVAVRETEVLSYEGAQILTQEVNKLYSDTIKNPRSINVDEWYYHYLLSHKDLQLIPNEFIPID